VVVDIRFDETQSQRDLQCAVEFETEGGSQTRQVTLEVSRSSATTLCGRSQWAHGRHEAQSVGHGRPIAVPVSLGRCGGRLGQPIDEAEGPIEGG